MTCQLSDEEYLGACDVNFFLRNLLLQIGSMKEHEIHEYSENYFRNIMLCNHVIGKDFEYIMSCRYNKRAFVYNLLKATQNFDKHVDFSPSDYFQIIDLICLNFPKKIVLEASHHINPKYGSGTSATYNHWEIRNAVCFYIIYQDWIDTITQPFLVENSPTYMNLIQFRNIIDQCHRNLPPTIEQPPRACIDFVISDTSITHIGDLSIDTFIRKLLMSPALVSSLYDYHVNVQYDPTVLYNARIDSLTSLSSGVTAKRS
jgi:hypothetical protein